MKKLIVLLTLILSTSVLASNRLYSECSGMGGHKDSDEELLGRFVIDDSDQTIKVYFGGNEKVDAIYSITEDTRSSSYRRGEQLLRGELIQGGNPFVSPAEAKHITVWVPNTLYYGSSEGSMSFAPKNYGIGTNVIYVMMDCIQNER